MAKFNSFILQLREKKKCPTEKRFQILEEVLMANFESCLIKLIGFSSLKTKTILSMIMSNFDKFSVIKILSDREPNW